MSAQLLHSIERYCADRGVLPSMFGRAAVNDPRLVSDLRSGRRPRQETVERIISLIREGKTIPSANPRSAAAGAKQNHTKIDRRRHWARYPHPVLADIARFLLSSGMSASEFGLMAMDDPNFVEDLRCGRRIRPKTEQKIRAFMREDIA